MKSAARRRPASRRRMAADHRPRPACSTCWTPLPPGTGRQARSEAQGRRQDRDAHRQARPSARGGAGEAAGAHGSAKQWRSVEPEQAEGGAEEGREEGRQEEKPETGLLKRTTAAADHSYWVYVPENYDPNVAYALVIWLHPAGKNKERRRRRLHLTSGSDFCEDNHLILVGPKADNENGWTPRRGRVRAGSGQGGDGRLHASTSGRVVAHGMGVGGEMAFYLGFHDRAPVPRRGDDRGAADQQPRRRSVADAAAGVLPRRRRQGPAQGRDQGQPDEAGATHKYPAVYREIQDMGHQYLDAACRR